MARPVALPRPAALPSSRGAAAFLLMLLVGAVVAPVIAPYAADALDLANRRAAPSVAHWFGTDELGRECGSPTRCWRSRAFRS